MNIYHKGIGSIIGLPGWFFHKKNKKSDKHQLFVTLLKGCAGMVALVGCESVMTKTYTSSQKLSKGTQYVSMFIIVPALYATNTIETKV